VPPEHLVDVVTVFSSFNGLFDELLGD